MKDLMEEDLTDLERVLILALATSIYEQNDVNEVYEFERCIRHADTLLKEKEHSGDCLKQSATCLLCLRNWFRDGIIKPALGVPGDAGEEELAKALRKLLR